MNARRLSGIFVFVVFVAACIPLVLHAMGKDADTMCLPYVIQQCGCHQKMGQKGCEADPSNKWQCECHDTTNGGVTSGTCTQTFHCEGKTSGGQGVDQGLSKLGEMLGKLMEALKGGGGGGGGGSPPPPTTPLTGCQGTQYQTPDVSKLTDPCAQYVAPGTTIDFPTSTSTTCDALSQALGTCAGASICPPVTVDCGDGYVQAPQTGTDANNCPLPNQCVLPNTTQNTPAGGVNVLCSAAKRLLGLCGGGPNLSGLGTTTGLLGGMTGNIFLDSSGATIVANSVNPGNNSTVAGFYGSNTLGNGQPQSIAASLCQNRPWSAGVLGIIPASFFDGLCTWQGYQVGSPSPQTAPVVEVHQTTPAPTSSHPATPVTTEVATSSVVSKVQIWAVPASVPLNTRTSIFWSTQGVTQCTETSPDGSFNQTSLSGGAATVPIVGPTTFTISCLDSAGNPVTGYVTVNLSI